MQSRFSVSLSRGVLTTLVVAPIGIMGILSVNVLFPALKDPGSRFYASGFGYPSLQRLTGKPIEVETVSVASKSLDNSLAAPGESVALEQVDVRPEVSGPVKKVYVVEGQWVRKGQPLFELDKAPFVDRVNTARNRLAGAEKNLQTLQNWAPQRLAKLRENVKFAQARLDSAKARLRENDALAQQEVKNNFEAAQVRLKTAQQKLQQIQLLEKQGAISKFQLYDMQDVYATRRKELQAARQGIFTVQDRLFSNQDFYLDLRNKVIAAQQDLQIAEEGIDRDLAKTRLSVENGRIELQNAVRDLSKTVIYATTDGLVSEVNINAGEIAESGSREPLVSLTQNVVFKGYIDQARLNAVKEGDKATVRLVAYPGRTFEGQVIQVNPTVETEVNRQRRVGVDRQYTYSIWVAVDELQMSPGLQGYVQFNKAKTALAIPESAVTHLSAGEGMVMVAEGGKAVVKKVKLGRTFDNQRQVIEGLTPGEQVVLNARALNPGDKLDIKSAPMPIADNR